MGPRATLRLSFASAEEAERVAGALRVDDDAFASTRREAADVVIEFRASNLRSLLRAVDDVLANAAVSEDLITPPPLDEA